MRWFSEKTDPVLFKCPCGREKCDAEPVETKLLDILESARDRLHEPIVVTSGPRCIWQNAKVGGAGDSGHVSGQAVDLRAQDPSYRRRLILALDRSGARRIFLYAGDGHVHVDTKEGTGWWVVGL